MNTTPRLLQQQRQSLVMTPQLQQSIKLLQMTTQELALFIETQLAENPLLELDGGEEGAAPTEVPLTREEKIQQRQEEGQPPQDVLTHNHSHEALADESYEESGESEARDDAAYWQVSGSGGSFEGEEDNALENRVAEELTLQEHLRRQLFIEVEDPTERILVLHLIDVLDEAGYVREPLEAIAAALGAELTQVEAALKRLQEFEPSGIGARDLAECLTLQLQDRNHYDPRIASLIAHLDLLARGELDQLAKRCQTSREEVMEMAAEIRTLNPKPGLSFAHEMTQPIRADVVVRPDGKGHWRVELNNDALPRVLVNERYATLVSQKTKGEEKRYVNEQFQHANWLVKALDQRAKTILKVATEITKQQDLFLKYGIRYLKPLTLKIIADAIEMHESTVSRVTTQKYIQTPRGLFEMKYFFTSSLGYDAGMGELSSSAVKAQIQLLIENETRENILSDDDIAKTLKERGIDIARRTVAKYREALGFGSSTDRRRQKKMGGA